MEEWKEYKLSNLALINKNTYSEKEDFKFINYLDTGSITKNKIENIQRINLEYEKLPSRAKRKVNINDIVYSTVRPNQLHYGIIKNVLDNFLVSTGFAVISVNPEMSDADFIYYYLTQDNITKELHAIAEQSTSAYPSIKPSDLGNLEIKIPLLEEQKKISKILSCLDNKIELNNKINENLEQQAQSIFKSWFKKEIENIESKKQFLGDLVEIIDNRGKTPPSKTEETLYPIIDVAALKNNGRIIDYENCTKYISEDTYNTFFRAGHPKLNDILLSTVGSLGQMKFFMGNKGCIAQNVVALRTKISPYYMYEYLKYIKQDLLAYDIGSVQPSIKITHIIKHPIYVPETQYLEKFDQIARPITEQIYNLSCENEDLKKLRDSLLPKLMSGEIDVSSIEV